jgi:hypothetical protein
VTEHIRAYLVPKSDNRLFDSFEGWSDVRSAAEIRPSFDQRQLLHPCRKLLVHRFSWQRAIQRIAGAFYRSKTDLSKGSLADDNWNTTAV